MSFGVNNFYFSNKKQAGESHRARPTILVSLLSAPWTLPTAPQKKECILWDKKTGIKKVLEQQSVKMNPNLICISYDEQLAGTHHQENAIALFRCPSCHATQSVA